MCMSVCAHTSSKAGRLIYSQQTASLGGNGEASCTCNSNVSALNESKQVILRDSSLHSVLCGPDG